MLRIALMGDTMLGRLMNEAAGVSGPAHLWGNTLGVLRSADLRILNLECVISDKGEPWSKTEKVFHFRALPWAMEALKAASIDYVSLANNHSLDYNEDAMLDMLRRLDEAGIKHAGAGRNAEEASIPAILEARGLKIALVSATDNVPEWEAKKDSPGVNFIPSWPTKDNVPYGRRLAGTRRLPLLGRLGGAAMTEAFTWPEMARRAKRLVSEARGSDLVIFSAHFGPNMVSRPSALFRRFARFVMDAGADVYHGHSAHIFQGIELRRGKPILYDTGDFVDDYEVDPVLRNDWSFIFLLDIDEKEKKAKKITLVPIYISGCQVNLAPEPLSGLICGKMAGLCAEMGTKTRREGDNLAIDLR